MYTVCCLVVVVVRGWGFFSLLFSCSVLTMNWTDRELILYFSENTDRTVGTDNLNRN